MNEEHDPYSGPNTVIRPISINGKDFLDIVEEAEQNPITPSNGLEEYDTVAQEEPHQHTVLVTWDPATGFESQVDDHINPVVLAGIAWYLEELAGITMRTQMQEQAMMAAMEQKKQAQTRAILTGHLAKGRN